MALLNVNRTVDDVFYRYKMPPLQAKIEGRGNGIKTVIPNMVEVARSLGRPPDYPTKYFGCELGAQTISDFKNERFIVNGAFQADRFQDLLDGFIRKFVLCPNCDNPETVLRVTSKKAIEQTCKACGHRGQIPLTHKLTTYILNHPPNGGDKKDTKLTKEERRAMKRARQQSQDSAKSGDGDEEDPASPTADAVNEINEDEVEWSADLSAEAVEARQRDELTGAVASLTMTDDLERPMSERLEIFHRFVEAKSKESPFPWKEAVAEAERLDCKEKGVMTLVEFLWTVETAPELLSAMKKNKNLILRFVFENKKAQKYLLGAVEKLVELNDGLLPAVPHIVKVLYDEDMVEEEVILAWGDKSSKKYVSKELNTKIREAAAPVLTWLREAEEEETSEEEEEDEVEFDPSAGKIAVKGGDTPSGDDEDEDDDLDIDDI